MTAQFCGQNKLDQSQPKDQSQPEVKPLGDVVPDVVPRNPRIPY